MTKGKTIAVLKSLTQRCQSCKFYCHAFNVTCNTHHEVCTKLGKEIPYVISCKEFENRIKNIDVTITAGDGSKIINTVDLIHIFDKRKIEFILRREGINLPTGTEGIIEYEVKLRMEVD